MKYLFFVLLCTLFLLTVLRLSGKNNQTKKNIFVVKNLYLFMYKQFSRVGIFINRPSKIFIVVLFTLSHVYISIDITKDNIHLKHYELKK